MTRVFVFNGDADGLCALQQLHLAEGAAGGSVLITGVKRDIALVRLADAGPGDEVTVLDVSLKPNREAVSRLLAAGAQVRYFDHHHAGEPLSHPAFEAHIDSSPQTCTSLIVDRHLRGAHRRWALVGAFGDNLGNSARALAVETDVSSAQLASLERLGIALNYNAYGESEEDLFYAPRLLHERLAPYADPVAFVAEDPAFRTLWSGYLSDLESVRSMQPMVRADHAAIYLLADSTRARRVGGVFANRVAVESPARAHAILVPNMHGGLVVSVRAPLERPLGAAALCLQFPGGGGREGAAGINDLQRSDLDAFVERFMRHFSVQVASTL